MRCITESLYCSCGSSLPFLASLVLASLALVQLVSLTLTIGHVYFLDQISLSHCSHL